MPSHSLRAIVLATATIASLNTHAQTNTVHPGDPVDWAIFPSGAVPVSFTTNEASTGAGSLEFGPIPATPGDKFLMAPPYGSVDWLTSLLADTRRSQFNSISYDFFPATLSASHFYLNVYVDQFGDGPATSFYDCRYDYTPSGTVGSWNTFQVTASTIPSNVAATGASVCPPTLAGGDANDEILYMVINGGQSNASDDGLIGHFDNVVLDAGGQTIVFDFEQDAAAAATPTSAHVAQPVPALPLWGLLTMPLGLLVMARRRLTKK